MIIEMPTNCSEFTATMIAIAAVELASHACRVPPSATTMSLSVPTLYWKSR